MSKREGLSRHLLTGFLLALLIYAAGYALFAHLQKRHGPWRVQFISQPGEPPRLVISEPQLAIAGARLTFAGQSAPATNFPMVFDQPREVPFELPFGKCTFMETISLPGTLVFVMFGHEIQLLPSSLTVDGKAYAWAQATNLELPK